MVRFEYSNVLNIKDGIICHQVNCADRMGSGVAKQIINKWPIVAEDYHTFIMDCAGIKDLLGRVHFCFVEENIMVCNMFSQRNYGYDGKRYTNYEAFANCLERIRDCGIIGTIHFPFGIGCGLGGANWDIILNMIEVILKDKDVVIHVRKEDKQKYEEGIK